MLVAVLLCSLAVGFLRGGDLKRLAQADLKGWWFYLTGFLLQVAIMSATFSLLERIRGLVYSLSFLFLIVGSWLDRNLDGAWWIVAGLIMNGMVISSNGGKMPIYVVPAYFRDDAQARTHLPITDSTRLWFLGDVIRFPLFGKHHLLLSPGDVLVAVGAFAVVQQLMVPRRRA